MAAANTSATMIRTMTTGAAIQVVELVDWFEEFAC